MIWLSWRQLRRAALLTGLATLAAVALLLVTGFRLADLAASTNTVYDLLTPGDRFLFYGGVFVLAVVPGLLGAFWGAPLVARELETGTHALVWGQSVSPARWLLTKLTVVLAVTAAVTGALSAAVTWWAAPLDGATSSTRGRLPGHLTPVSFGMRGSVPIGYALLAVVLGVGVGLLLRRTLPAMALTLALMVAFQVAMPLWVRPHLAPPVTSLVTLSDRTLDGVAADGAGRPVAFTAHTNDPADWILTNETVDRAGRVGLPAWVGSCTSDSAPGTSDQAQVDSPDPCLARLAAAGYHQKLVYQPADRFWRLQVTETLVCLALAALLAGLVVARIRRPG